jgi:diguanylate cyclase (GGDEF)-like protein
MKMIENNLSSDIVKILLMALIYFITGKISFMVFSQDMIVTMTAFAPEGFALAGVLIYGRSVLPGIFLGQLILGLSSGMALSSIIPISLINTLEAYIALRLFTYFKLNKELLSIRDVFGLLALILFVLQPFSAILGNAILLILDIVTLDGYFHDIFFWWFGNVMGQLLFTPMILILYYNRQKVKLQNFSYVLLFFLILNYILQVSLEVDNVSILLMITLPTTIFLTTTNLSYASLASVVLASISLYFTHLGVGTFTKEGTQIDNIINLNFFMVSHIILVLIIGILFREKQDAIESLRSMAHYDYLTGLPNRHLLREEIHHSVFLAHDQNQKAAICFIDVDGFKPINDTYGHSIGDKLLQEVVQRVRIFTQSEDAFLRIGGDEFLVVFNHCDSKEKLDHTLEQILSSVVEGMFIEGHEIKVSLSIGVACCPKHGTTVESLMDHADNAMYEAKKRGKNQYVYTKL